MQPRRSKRRFQTLKQIFRRRNIIVVSDEAIDHYPVSGKLQLVGLVSVIGMFSWISYSTGSYVASQAVLQQKEQQIASTTQQNRQLGEEYTLLKRDLLKLKDNNGELSDYTQFMLEQYTESADEGFEAAFLSDANGGSPTSNRLIERINFLEKEIDSLQNENEQIIETVRERTRDKIKELRDVITMSGLNVRKMERRAEKELAETVLPESEDSKGGPYIPEELSELDTDFFTDIDRMMLLDAVVNQLPIANPMPEARITSGFGRRVDPFTRRWAMHSGQDFAGPHQGGVHAGADGIVTIAERKGAYGNLVEIDHGLGITTRYGHLSRIVVKEGDVVKAGQRVGTQGSTGRSTGSHLHYEVRMNNRPLNPSKFLKAGEYVQKQ